MRHYKDHGAVLYSSSYAITNLKLMYQRESDRPRSQSCAASTFLPVPHTHLSSPSLIPNPIVIFRLLLLREVMREALLHLHRDNSAGPYQMHGSDFCCHLHESSMDGISFSSKPPLTEKAMVQRVDV